MSTWTSGHITEAPPPTQKKSVHVSEEESVFMEGWEASWGDGVHAVELKYLEVQSSLASVHQGGGQRGYPKVDSSPSTPGETGASVAFFIVS